MAHRDGELNRVVEYGQERDVENDGADTDEVDENVETAQDEAVENQDKSYFRIVTIHVFDRPTDRIFITRPHGMSGLSTMQKII